MDLLLMSGMEHPTKHDISYSKPTKYRTNQSEGEKTCFWTSEEEEAGLSKQQTLQNLFDSAKKQQLYEGWRITLPRRLHKAIWLSLQ